MHMQGRKQLERRTTVNAPIGVVYRLFMDNAELANWAPAVDAVIGQRGGDGTGQGATRTCAVTMNGKKGTMVERCIEAVPETRASFLVVDDSFGFGKMLTGYGFTAHFTPAASDQTHGAGRDVLHASPPDRRRAQQAGHAAEVPQRRRRAPRAAVHARRAAPHPARTLSPPH
jgi:uncharacterized protein YndB with AHSA1/START domain